MQMRDIAEFFKALADEARLQMLWLLFNHRELCVCDLVAALGITQSKASRHLATLRHAGLVVDRREAMWSHYSLLSVDDDLKRAQLASLRARLGERPDAARLLRDLDDWMKRKDRAATCARVAGRGRATSGRTSAPRSGKPRTSGR